MQETNIYNSSSFFETEEGEIDARFTDFSDLPCQRPWLCLKRVKRFGQWWIVKGVNPGFEPREKAQALLDREFERCMTLWHPSIVRMIAQQEVPTMQGRCIIEEWVDGISFILCEQGRDTWQPQGKQCACHSQWRSRQAHRFRARCI